MHPSALPTRVIAESDGTLVALGAELGRGGEGVVYELPTSREFVAKLYHVQPDAPKQSKLRLMADSIDSPLRNYAAWPEETLHDASGAVIGFTMQRIEKRSPIHMLYSPAQRRETFPSARFDFLVFVARNIAAAFETLHAHGHVLGDVNQGNVLVGEDSRVILIDCDSFQIHVGDALHRCEVGVAHFTPPELQSVSSFEDITRTPNHDGFGLALLIFHLLMGGRHPYSGVPLADNVGVSLEADIRDFRYAYAKDAPTRLMSPPPKSVPIDSLPPAIIDLFQRAFIEGGVAARPTPQQWVAALDALRAQLKFCGKRPLHMHCGHQVECIWCALERRHVVIFGPVSGAPGTAAARGPSSAASAPGSIDVVAMEAAIAKLKESTPLQMPRLSMLRAPYTEVELDAYLTGRGFLAAVPGGAIAAAFAVPFLLTPALLATIVLGSGVLTGLGGLAMASMLGVTRARDYRDAVARLRMLERSVADRVDDVNKSAGIGLVKTWRQAEKELRQFKSREHAALAGFKLDVDAASLRVFLQGKLIERWRDPRVSVAERIRLRAAGIESAADFDKPALAKLNLIGDDARAALIAWKQQLVSERRRTLPGATPGLNEFTAARLQQQRNIEKQLSDIYAKIQGSLQHGSLVLQAQRNQLADLERELHAQHARCVELARLQPKIERIGVPNSPQQL